LRLIRSWPAAVPEHRAHVVDGCERLVMDSFDYSPLADYDDDILLIEWDIATTAEDLLFFAADARRDPSRVLVAPYRLYAAPGGDLERKWSGHMNADGGFWVHLRYDGLLMEPVATGDPFCQTFGFGLTYLPRDLIRGYVEAARRFPLLRKLNDTSFSLWHHNHIQRDVPICWDVRPVHLHFDFPAF
jgi:hypothetical protein